MNWKVNPCLPICPLYARRCNFRKFSYAVKWNAEYRKSGQMDRMLDIYDAITFYPLGDEHWRQWTPAMVYEILASSVQYINCCGLLVQRFIRMANEELDKTLLDEMGLITGELARFKKSLADGDKVVLHNVAYLLYMIELGKLRMSKLNKLTFRDKSGAVRMHPLVNDIQKLIKDAVSIMDAQGWTTAGERRLKGVENKDKRGAALDLIEGRDYVVEDGPAALPEKVMGIAEKLIEMDSEEIEALDHEKEEPRGGKPLPESVRQRIEGETKTIWED